MNIHEIVDQLRQEIARLQTAVEALVGTGSGQTRRGRPAKHGAQPGTQRRTMSASARARISAAQKARWAKQKGQASTQLAKKTSAPAAKSAGRKRMSPAARKKLSALMKARWAARQKAAGA